MRSWPSSRETDAAQAGAHRCYKERMEELIELDHGRQRAGAAGSGGAAYAGAAHTMAWRAARALRRTAQAGPGRIRLDEPGMCLRQPRHLPLHLAL